MAHQDYVARPRATKNKKKPYKTKGKQPAEKSGLSAALVWPVVIALISLFSYALYYMSSNASDDVEVTEIKLPPKNKPQTIVEDTLPELPKEQWSYVENLRDMEVEVNTDRYEVKDKGPYQMQCASFRNQKDAEVLKAKIAFAGFGSNIRKATGSNGTWYKVVLGPFERKRQAEKVRHKLKNNKINGCQIWFWT